MFSFVRYIKKLDPVKKDKMRVKLAAIYAIIAWNGFAISLYILSNERYESPNTPKALSKVLNSKTEESRVIRIKGFNVIENTIYDKKQLDEIRHNIKNPPKTLPDDNSDF